MRMETIDDILREMRSGKLSATVVCENCGCESEQRFRFDLLADRIEAAVKHQFRDTTKTMPEKVAVAENATTTPTCDKSSQVGNAAALRKALRKIHLIATTNINECACNDSDRTICKLAEEALAKPPRNCDLYKSEPEAYQAYLTAMKNATKKTYVYFEPWLFAEVKGDEK